MCVIYTQITHIMCVCVWDYITEQTHTHVQNTETLIPPEDTALTGADGFVLCTGVCEHLLCSYMVVKFPTAGLRARQEPLHTVMRLGDGQTERRTCSLPGESLSSAEGRHSFPEN